MAYEHLFNHELLQTYQDNQEQLQMLQALQQGLRNEIVARKLALPADDSNQYSVCQYFPDDTWEYVEPRSVSYDTAVAMLKERSGWPAAKIGIVTRITVTDNAKVCHFQWEHGKGITFPRDQPEAA